jgi:hypothetical protein
MDRKINYLIFILFYFIFPTQLLTPIDRLKIPAQISNGERFKPALAERVKKQTTIHLRGISTNWLKTSYIPPQGFLGYGLCTYNQLHI